MTARDLELRVAWQRHVGQGTVADETFAALIARHRAPGRHYHGERHVQWVVRHVLDLVERTDVTDLDAVVAAAFFHDAVYEPDRDDNEVRSAELADTTLSKLGWDADRRRRVVAMIVATEHLSGPAPTDSRVDDTSIDAETAVLLAADLAVLAADPGAYSDYARAIRREYAHLDDDAWRVGRHRVISGLLDRATIFPPELDLDAWERRARANLAAEAAALR